MINLISLFITLLTLPFIEHMFVFAGLFSVFGLYAIISSEGLDIKSYTITMVLLSLILDIAMNFGFGTYLFAASISVFTYHVLYKVFPDLNIVVKYFTLFITFVVFNLMLYITSSLQLGLSIVELFTLSSISSEVLTALWGLPMYWIFISLSSFTRSGGSKHFLKLK